MKRMSSDPTTITNIILPLNQFIILIIAIVGAALAIIKYIHHQIQPLQVSKGTTDTEIKNLKENLKRAEDDITYITRLYYQEGRPAAGRMRNDIKSRNSERSETGNETGDEAT